MWIINSFYSVYFCSMKDPGTQQFLVTIAEMSFYCKTVVLTTSPKCGLMGYI